MKSSVMFYIFAAADHLLHPDPAEKAVSKEASSSSVSNALRAPWKGWSTLERTATHRRYKDHNYAKILPAKPTDNL